MTQRNTDERLATLEEQVALLLHFKQEQEAFNQVQETHDIALFARVDSISNDLRRVERTQIRGFEELRTEMRAGHEYLTMRLDIVEDDLTKVVEMGVKHREAIDMLLAGQQAHTEAITALQKGQQEVMATLQQVVEMLMGRPRRND